jgi:hypothetical protein
MSFSGTETKSEEYTCLTVTTKGWRGKTLQLTGPQPTTTTTGASITFTLSDRPEYQDTSLINIIQDNQVRLVDTSLLFSELVEATVIGLSLVVISGPFLLINGRMDYVSIKAIWLTVLSLDSWSFSTFYLNFCLIKLIYLHKIVISSYIFCLPWFSTLSS